MARTIALVGVGKIALDQHVPAIADSPDWALAATHSKEGGVPGVPAFADFDRLLAERGDIEAVALCVPPQARFDLAARALAARRHVLLEKPPGATISECRTLRAMAEAAGRSIYATWHSREADHVAGAKAWLADKTLRRFSVVWREDARQWHPGQVWIWRAGGMGVFDPGINALSIVTEILPDPIRLIDAELTFPANCEAPAQARLRYVHPKGAETTMEMDFLAEGPPTWTIAMETDEGSATLENGGARFVIDGREQAAPEASGLFAGREGAAPIGREYPRIYAKFAAMIARGASDMDLAPLEHVVDAFALARRRIGPEFHDPAAG